jgi:hypothetical protein
MPQSKKSAPKTVKTPRYHVYKVEQDLGEVVPAAGASLEDVVDLTTQGPAQGQFIVFDDGGNANIVTLQPATTMNVTKNSPKDLFS